MSCCAFLRTGQLRRGEPLRSGDMHEQTPNEEATGHPLKGITCCWSGFLRCSRPSSRNGCACKHGLGVLLEQSYTGPTLLRKVTMYKSSKKDISSMHHLAPRLHLRESCALFQYHLPTNILPEPHRTSGQTATLNSLIPRGSTNATWLPWTSNRTR